MATKKQKKKARAKPKKPDTPKQEEQEAQEAQEPTPPPAPQGKPTCTTCADCDVKNYGFCSNAAARNELDMWNGVIFNTEEFGCMHHTPRPAKGG